MAQTFGHTLYQLRKAKGFTAKELACTIGVDPSYITLLENGRRSPPKRELIQKVAQALALTADDTAQLKSAAVSDRIFETLELDQTHDPFVSLTRDLLEFSQSLTESEFSVIRSILLAWKVTKAAQTLHCSTTSDAR